MENITVPINNERSILLGGCQDDTRVRLEPAIRSLGFSLEFARGADAIHTSLHTSERDIAALIIDVTMPGQEAFDTVQAVRAADPDLPVIVIALRPSTQDIVAAMRCGATDVLSSPITHEGTVEILTRALETCGARRAQSSQNPDGADFFIGSNVRMKEIHAMVAQIGKSTVPVLIQGETGTGKEVLARALHSRSPRAGRPFLKLNCAALPSELVESELFGYERGAFTGAFKRKEGMFELADGGTLLLDEIGDMDIRLQAKLLQVLQDREFRRVGGKDTVKVDVRIIAASHRNLEQAILDRAFREDLYYRLNVVTFVVPPLRNRKEDIVPIAEFLMKKHTAKETTRDRREEVIPIADFLNRKQPAKEISIPHISIELKQAMMAYHWPGNVRELENYVRKLIIFQDGSAIARDLRIRAQGDPPVESRPRATTFPVAAPNMSALEQATRAKAQAETDAILAALNSTHWNRKQAAALLKIEYKSLLYKMKRLGIDSSPICGSDPDETPFERLQSAGGN